MNINCMITYVIYKTANRVFAIFFTLLIKSIFFNAEYLLFL